MRNHRHARDGRIDLPNLEVYAELAGMVRRWMTPQVGGSSELQAFFGADTGSTESTLTALEP